MKEYCTLTINPGSTSTKVTVFRGEQVLLDTTLRYKAEDLKKYMTINDQFELRREDIMSFITDSCFDLEELDAVVGRGGLLKPIPGGTYLINQTMLDDLEKARFGEHASNLGAPLAYNIAEDLGISSYIVDPVVIDELDDLARISGYSGIERKSIFHALNQKAIARRAARDMERNYNELNLIIAHLGGGISVAAHKQGKVVDVNNALDGDGPFSPERSGGLPFGDIMKMSIASSLDLQSLKKQFVGQGGLVSYLKTNDAREVCKRIETGDENAALVYEAMAYQIAKEISSLAAVFNGKVDAIVITGGIANETRLVQWIMERVEFIAPIKLYPGEDEAKALHEGALRVLKNEEQPHIY